MSIENADVRELRTHDHIETEMCVVDGVDHDFRPYSYTSGGGRWEHTSWRCVWCHGVACGDYGADDPCMKIYHHRDEHRSRAGATWPLGGSRVEED